MFRMCKSMWLALALLVGSGLHHSVEAKPTQASSGSGITADRQGFKSQVQPLLKTYCVRCHGPEKQKGKLALHHIDPDILHGDDFEVWRVIAERLQFGEMPPAGARQPKAVEKKVLLGWIRTELLKTQQPGVVTDQKLVLPNYGNYVDHHELFEKPAGPVIPVAPRIWRLRPLLYRTIHERAADGARGLANPFSVIPDKGFKDFAAPYYVDEATTDILYRNAETLVKQQLAKRNRYRAFKPLVGEKAPTEEQVHQAIELQFRLVMHRGPSEEELKRFTELHARVARKSGLAIAGRAMLIAILMQPETVFRLELGTGKPDEHGRVRLSPSEIARALSFALEDRVDRRFFDVASKGKLATHEQVAEVVARVLDDPKGDNPRILQFFREYFGYPEARNVFKDPDPRTKHNANVLVSDLEFLIRHILRKDRDVLRELLTTNKAFVNYKVDKKRKTVSRAERSATYVTAYGLPPDWKWTPEQPIELPEYQHAGVLTHPAWLVAWSGNFDNHPVQRGRWVREKLLGGSVPDVPIGVDARIPEDKHKTLRERLDQVSNGPECWRCHKKMNPLGVVFEQFDHYGRWRKLEVGKPVVTTGYVDRTGVQGLEFKVKDPVELMHKLANSPHVEQVFVRHVFRYFMGRNETLGDAATLQQAYRAYKSSGGSFKALIIALLSSDSFLYRMPTQPNS